MAGVHVSPLTAVTVFGAVIWWHLFPKANVNEDKIDLMVKMLKHQVLAAMIILLRLVLL